MYIKFAGGDNAEDGSLFIPTKEWQEVKPGIQKMCLLIIDISINNN